MPGSSPAIVLGFTLLLLSSVLTGCDSGVTEDGLVVETVATGLEVPWEMRFLPDGDLLITERGGRVARVSPSSGEVREMA